MSTPTYLGTETDPALSDSLRRELLRLARIEDDTAAREAATVPYWSPSPASVLGHRVAASVLRDSADRLCSAHRPALR